MRVGGFETLAPVPPFPTGEPGFLQELKTWDIRQPHWNTEKEIPENTLPLAGCWQIKKSFPDPEGLLETAYAALDRFTRNHIPSGNGSVSVTAECDDALEYEAYTVAVSAEGITLRASCTEGMRRALYYLIDLCRSADMPALKYQHISRKPWLKNRISRCFFGPIKRPPFFRDELTDDIDYYPEPYLDRLAAEGVNGIWLTIVWKEMADTSFFPMDPKREQRIGKLKRTVEKCRRYGIKVWVFCIEPMSWTEQHVPPFEDMRGDCHFANIAHSFCIASENSKKYIRDTVYSIFRDTPHLGGMMLISLGERATSCLSYVYSSKQGKQACSGRCGMSNSQILNGVLSAIRQGIRDAGSDAQVLSWLYNPTAQQIPEWWFSLPEELDHEKILAFNFESGCSKAQDGRVYSGGDYWLSCPGPSDRFGRMAAAARGHCDFAAKIQVGCSHELATIPFMPVPGNLYEKYHAMKQLGITHVIQCWYFGNYPGLMNRAAGELAFENFEDTELDFLSRLAAPEWGNAYAPQIAEMWHRFGRAYSSYPLDIQFQYYGPMHDGVVWPLHLKQVMRSLPRSWKPDAAPAGDAVGESMINHDLNNTVILTRTLAEQWKIAAEILPELRRVFADDPARQRDCDLYEALELLFSSGARIMAFYQMRAALFSSPLGCHALLEEMRRIVHAEKAASARMIRLCESDCRLGYHSEAEVFKFYPAKLQWRIAELEKLDGVFDLLAGVSPERVKELLAWEGTVYRTGREYRGRTFVWRADVEKLDLKFTIKFDPVEKDNSPEYQFILLMDAAGTRFPMQFPVSDDGVPAGINDKGIGILIETGAAGEKIVRIPLSKINFAGEIFAGVLRTWKTPDGKFCHDVTPDGDYIWEDRLNLPGYFSPEKMCKLVIG
ncbi:MAG: hypothetical protein IKC65_03905 [Lentisphaeria bacterium]|nr:hypothetical protein [Lentisphaeria bacterium]